MKLESNGNVHTHTHTYICTSAPTFPLLIAAWIPVGVSGFFAFIALIPGAPPVFALIRFMAANFFIDLAISAELEVERGGWRMQGEHDYLSDRANGNKVAA